MGALDLRRAGVRVSRCFVLASLESRSGALVVTDKEHRTWLELEIGHSVAAESASHTVTFAEPGKVMNLVIEDVHFPEMNRKAASQDPSGILAPLVVANRCF